MISFVVIRNSYVVLVLILVFAKNAPAQSIHKKNLLHSGDFNQLRTFINKSDDTLRIINFWATWCAPCVEELKYFLKAEKRLASKPVSFIYVSLDFKKDLKKKLVPFMRKKMSRSFVWWLDDVRANEWIPQVNDSWSGNIPATLLYKKSNRIFLAESINSKQLDSLVSLF